MKDGILVCGQIRIGATTTVVIVGRTTRGSGGFLWCIRSANARVGEGRNTRDSDPSTGIRGANAPQKYDSYFCAGPQRVGLSTSLQFITDGNVSWMSSFVK